MTIMGLLRRPDLSGLPRNDAESRYSPGSALLHLSVAPWRATPACIAFLSLTLHIANLADSPLVTLVPMPGFQPGENRGPGGFGIDSTSSK